METSGTDGVGVLGWADVEACSLPTVARPLRVAEFDNLFATSLRSVERDGDVRARLALSGSADLAARTQHLADAESSCCSFFSFIVSEDAPGRVSLDVEVPAAYADVLAGLLARAEAAGSAR
jgi:hypothetical protein